MIRHPIALFSSPNLLRLKKTSQCISWSQRYPKHVTTKEPREIFEISFVSCPSPNPSDSFQSSLLCKSFEISLRSRLFEILAVYLSLTPQPSLTMSSSLEVSSAPGTINVISKIETVFESILNALLATEPISIAIRMKKPPQTTLTTASGIKAWREMIVSFPGKTEEESRKFGTSNWL